MSPSVQRVWFVLDKVAALALFGLVQWFLIAACLQIGLSIPAAIVATIVMDVAAALHMH